MPSPQVTRFPSGVVDATEDGAYGRYAGLRPFRYGNWIEEFYNFVPGDWVVTETAAGSTQLIVNGDNGVLALTNVSAGATDATSLQWAGNSGAAVTMATWDGTKDILIASRFKISHASNAALLVGLASVDTTPVASLPTNGIYFYKASGAASLIASTRIAGASTSVTLGDMVADTYVDAVFRYVTDTGNWQAFLNNALVGTFAGASVTPTAALTVTIGLLSATAAAHALSVDYLQVAQQR